MQVEGKDIGVHEGLAALTQNVDGFLQKLNLNPGHVVLLHCFHTLFYTCIQLQQPTQNITNYKANNPQHAVLLYHLYMLFYNCAKLQHHTTTIISCSNNIIMQVLHCYNIIIMTTKLSTSTQLYNTSVQLQHTTNQCSHIIALSHIDLLWLSKSAVKLWFFNSIKPYQNRLTLAREKL